MRCQLHYNFKCIEYLCQLGKEHLISLTSKFYTFSSRNFKTLTYYMPFYN